MAITVANILVGEGNLYLTVSTSSTSYVHVGATQGGVELTWEPSMVDIEVDQFGDAAKVVEERQKATVKTTLAEASLANLAFAWNYRTGLSGDIANLTSQSGVSGTVFNFGLQSAYPIERKLLFTGVSPNSTAVSQKLRNFYANRAISYDAVSMKNSRGENVALPVTFRILPDPTLTGQEYGQISDA